MIWQRIQPGDVVQNPKRGQHERVIDCLRAGPDFLQPERADDAWIPGQVRFIVPNEAGMEDRRVRNENERD